LGLSLLISGLVLFLTQSRSGWLGLVVGLAAMSAWVNKRARIVVLVLSVALLAIAVVQGPSWFRAALSTGMASDVLGRLNWGFRIGIWRAALWGIADFPLTGMGFGAFRRVASALYPLPYMPVGYDFAHAHNGFFQAALDLGLPGLLAYAAIWLLSARMIFSCLRRARGLPPTEHSAQLVSLALGFLGCLAASFVYNWTDTVALGAKGGLPWWMMLGLIVALSRYVEGLGQGDNRDE
jgi:O-antigen ligase